MIFIVEVMFINLYNDIIISVENFFIKMIAYMFCFRSEVGSVGKDIRGMIR